MTKARSPEAADQPTTASDRPWVRRVVIGGVGLLSSLVAWFIGAAVIPRWWAQRIGDIVDGRLTTGTLFGLAMGATFTLAPLLVLFLGWKLRNGWKRFLGFVVAAAVAAFPNLATLGIVLGNGNAAHAGDRILDVDAPGFRGGSLVGAIVAAVGFVAVAALVRSRRRNKQRARELAHELSERG